MNEIDPRQGMPADERALLAEQLYIVVTRSGTTIIGQSGAWYTGRDAPYGSATLKRAGTWFTAVMEHRNHVGQPISLQVQEPVVLPYLGLRAPSVVVECLEAIVDVSKLEPKLQELVVKKYIDYVDPPQVVRAGLAV